MWRGYVAMRRAIEQAIERQLAGHGLSNADYELLVPLSEAPDHVLRARDLGRIAGWDRSRLAHQVRRMEQRGLVRRYSCPTDARGTMIELTPSGRAAIEKAAPGHVEAVRRVFVDLLEEEELAAITAVAHRVADTATAATCDAEEACDGEPA